MSARSGGAHCLLVGAAVAAVIATSPVHAADRAPDAPADYAWRWRLATSTAPLQRVVLPPAIYDGVAHADLRDLRVFNAAHEIVPYAFVPPTLPVAPPVQRPLPLFPLLVDAAHPSIDDVALRVSRSAGGTTIEVAPQGGRATAGTRLAGYVLDASTLDAVVPALVVVPAGNDNVDVRLRIEASDDLAAWEVVAPSTTLLRLVVSERRLGRDRLPIAPRKARYFRVSPADGRPMPVLTSVAAETGATSPEPQVDWRELAAVADPDGGRAFVYDAGAPLPATQLRLDLPASNTVVPIVVQARNRPQDEWRVVTSGVAYRFGDAAGESRSAPLTLQGSAYRHWKIVPDERAGIASAPRLALGWTPPAIVFAARGDAPFELAYGRRDAISGALPVATLVPQTSGPALLDRAVVVAPVAAPLAGNAAALRERLPIARIALWATLGLAAALLVALGVRLLRQVQANDPPTGGNPPG